MLQNIHKCTDVNALELIEMGAVAQLKLLQTARIKNYKKEEDEVIQEISYY